MKISSGLVLLFIAFLLLWLYYIHSVNENVHRYNEEIEEIKSTLKNANYNNEYCFLVDFSLHSGKKRMFLYNLKTQKIERSFMVAHGEGCGQENGTPETFSNIPNSLCSSEGMAVIGNRDYSNWGINIKYWLEGLDKTNNNMRKRVVVIHSWSGIPDFSIYPFKIVQSQGCFTMSNSALTYLDNFISKQDNKRILFYTFKS
ncbi:murein L,D-transpeptidase catalytic domain-containing protein [Salegentibacter maritimus]|uniref:murein L,D-transpeptidase catalytic domain-containing protein n=1 Tax=Salegentibacter maritimus TaxID=2794347 RepID=UPI0018E43276|nr:murein L,D-transpeptidase catalytic domain family protein [Salegentibacter maritimus]MBI6115980.1 murein L,D-transpeptidase catalytic domain family protein [Salegentibacter maritimus]